MKVILKHEVDNLGLPGDMVEVADGYGRNYLLPRDMAIPATKGAEREAEALLRKRKARESETLGEAEQMREVLESRTLQIPARVDERGHLYGSVSMQDIARVLKERGHDIPVKRIETRGTFKQIGTYEVPVRVHPQVVATVTVEVTDIEGVVGVQPAQPAEVEVDQDEVAQEAAQAAEGSQTDPDVLAEQALEAAEAYERQQAARAAERETGTDQDPDQTVTDA